MSGRGEIHYLPLIQYYQLRAPLSAGIRIIHYLFVPYPELWTFFRVTTFAREIKVTPPLPLDP